MEINAATMADRLVGIARALAIPEPSRIAECIAALRAGAEQLGRHGVIAGEENVRRFVLALQDATLIADTFAALHSARDLRGVETRLRAAFAGGSLQVPAAGNDHARDELWCLFVCACLRNNGYSPRFAEDVCSAGEKKPDLFVSSAGVVLAVEAKRNRVGAVLGERVNKAVTQIAAAVRAGHCAKGFLAIDASVSLEQHAQHSLWQIASDESLPVVREKLKPIIANCVVEVHDAISRHPEHESVVGATILTLPATLRADTRQVGLIRCYLSVPFDDNSPAYGQLASRCFADR